jgi:hypothetical protein
MVFRRRLTTGVVLVYGLALVVAAHHRAAVEHGCTEHGEAIHLEPNTDVAPSHEQPFYCHHARLGDKHHCGVLAFLSQPIRLGELAGEVSTGQPASRARLLSLESPAAGIALLRLSPKTSPPV